jgi:hypothetical protein
LPSAEGSGNRIGKTAKMKNWKKYVDREYVYALENDSGRPSVDSDGNMTFMHEAAMEYALGRKIRDNEFLYNLDGNALNYQRANLAIRTMEPEEMADRAKQSRCFWRELLPLLEPNSSR